MSKINQFRRRVLDSYHAFDLDEAARHGEALLREHWHNRTMLTPGYADDIYNLARVYDELGKFDRAVELYTDGAHLYSRLASGDPTGYTNCLNNLAAVLHDMGQEESSAQLFGQLVSVKQFFSGDEDALFADSLYNLANAIADNEKHTGQAKQWHKQALKIRRKEGNTDDIIDSLHSLAYLHEMKEEYEKAVPLAETAMELAEGDDYTIAVFYLASLYDAWGQNELAAKLYEEAMGLIYARVGKHHASYLDAATSLALLFDTMGRVNDALLLQKEIRALYEATDGTAHIEYAECLRQSAELHKQLGEYDQAEALLLRSMKINLHHNRPLLEDIVHLIRLYLRAGDSDRALEVLVYALMRGESKGAGLGQLLTKLAIAFNPGTDPAPEGILQALRAMNDRERLTPILKKWSAWEKELFIPAFVMPPPAGRDTK